MGEGVHHTEGPRLQSDALRSRLVEQAQDGLGAQGKVRSLLRANRSIVGDLNLTSVLERIVVVACHLVDAPYGALGVIAADGTGVQDFIHSGIDEETVRRIGHLPQGRGLLGALIDDPRPIRLRVIGDDPRSVGFPPGHPEMKGFLGVPIRVRGEIFGNLYLASPREGNFTPEDEELVLSLAATAGVAIENARLYEESVQRQEWLEATTDMTRRVLVASGEQALRTIGQRVAELAVADLVAVVLPAQEDLLGVAVAVGLDAERLAHFNYQLAGTVAEKVLRTGQPEVFEDAARHHGDGLSRVVIGDVVPLGPVMVLPMAGGEAVSGVLVVGRRPGAHPFAEAEVAMATNFAHHGSVALELAEARREAQRSLILEDRARIARDLHDQVIQQLFAAGMSLQGAAAKAEGGVSDLISDVVDQLDDAIRQIRTYIFHLRTEPGSSVGLRGQLLEVCASFAPSLGYLPRLQFIGPVDSATDERLSDDVCAVVRESLSNVARHAEASTALVVARVRGDRLEVSVQDDGKGIGTPERRSGLHNLEQRARARSGTYTVQPGEGNGTRVTWSVPTPRAGTRRETLDDE
ncbi:GAF domain-containing protein [Nocardioides gilvus]|uniref:sensor histidine kinase n=1 Tax=Nocardioides gilvus TaxID=1735589 RepID=UPI000D74CE33|nr:GAF domain-containing protein [Nocardioides gilvus]